MITQAWHPENLLVGVPYRVRFSYHAGRTYQEFAGEFTKMVVRGGTLWLWFRLVSTAYDTRDFPIQARHITGLTLLGDCDD